MRAAASRVFRRCFRRSPGRLSEAAGDKKAPREEPKELDPASAEKRPAPEIVSDLGMDKLPPRFHGLSDADKLLLDPTLDPLYKQKSAAKAAGAFGLFLLFMGGMQIFEGQLKAEIEQKAEEKEKPKFSVFVPRNVQQPDIEDPKMAIAKAIPSLKQTSVPEPVTHVQTPPPTPEEFEAAKTEAAEKMLAAGRQMVEEAEAEQLDPETGEPKPRAVLPVFTSTKGDEPEEELSELDDMLLQEVELEYRLKKLRSLKKSKEVDSEKKEIKESLKILTEKLAQMNK